MLAEGFVPIEHNLVDLLCCRWVQERALTRTKLAAGGAGEMKHTHAGVDKVAIGTPPAIRVIRAPKQMANSALAKAASR